MARAAIVIIGDEILSGRTLDTNSHFLIKQLNKLGIYLQKTTVIHDNEEEIYNALTDGIKNHDITISTGGLGPTKDDLTVNVASKIFHSKLVFNKNLYETIKAKEEKETETLKKQAYVPEKALLLENPVGNAPGILFRKDKKLLILLPGVPSEVKAIFNTSLIPYLKEFTDIKKKVFTVRTFGLPETELSDLIQQRFLKKIEKISFLPSLRGVDLLITTDMETFLSIKKELGKHIYTFDNKNIEEILKNICKDKNLTLSIAESCTGGLLGKTITDVSGSSEYFKGGIIAYSNEIKTSLLNVKKRTIEDFGAVSKEVAIEMAEGAAKLTKSSLSISVTGIAGPLGGSKEKPVGLVYAGFKHNNKTTYKKYNFTGTRDIIRKKTVYTVLFDLLQLIKT